MNTSNLPGAEAILPGNALLNSLNGFCTALESIAKYQRIHRQA
jgi:hypothetical protein